MTSRESSKSAERETIDHYSSHDEAERLTKDIGPLELARTRELIMRYLPPPPAVVADVGGASGAYAFWLAELGYAVHLVDLVPRHIEQARRKAEDPSSPRLAGMSVADARKLPLADAFADAV